MGFIRAIVLIGVFSVANAYPPSQQDYGLCSQIYVMHQYCTSQLTPASTTLSHRHTQLPRVGKAGPRGPRGIVNYTAIEEKMAVMFSDWEANMEEKFLAMKNASIQEIEKIKADIENKTEETELLNDIEVLNSCDEARRDGMAKIQRGGNIYPVYCDTSTDGGKWTVFQRRMDGSVNFYRTWEEYASGFGNPDGEFWLGLEAVYQLTQDGDYELRVDLTDWDGSTAYAKYTTFSINGRSDDYRLTVRGYSGTAGDSLTYSNGYRFSAKDKDLDGSSSNCALSLAHAAWWFNNCAHSSLNGIYRDTSDSYTGVLWYYWKNRWSYSLKGSEMKIRKK